ncbi:MAG TPA: HAD family phosphatase [Verrucomicrobiae bacterium]|jgi:putative hydrolase of the HAD superfamily
MKPAIVFDLGKVLVDFDYSIAARKILARSTKKLPGLPQSLGSLELLMRFESGLTNRAQFFAEIKEALGYTGDLAEFVRDLGDIFVEIPRMIELHAEFRRQGFSTYIFSNTNDIAVEHIRHHYPFFAHFNGYIYSYEVGGMKPYPKIYEAMEKLCGRSGKEIVYIDDRPENIDTGMARGWDSILHESPEKTRSLLKHLL